MKLQLVIRRIAGFIILTGLILGYFVNAYWLLLAAFVGLNLLQSSFTNFCPVEKVLEKKVWKDQKPESKLEIES